MKICPKCNSENADVYLFCMQCGEKIDASSEVTSTLVNGNAEVDNDVPKTRIARNMEELMAQEGEVGAKTEIFQSTESRINPQLIKIDDEGVDGDVFDITKVTTVIGRTEGELTFPSDTYLSPEHCFFTFSDGKLSVEDFDSFNGIYIKIRERINLTDGAFILTGQQLLQFFPFSYKNIMVPPMPEMEDIINFYGTSNKKIIALLKQIFSDRSEGNRYYLTRDRVVIGRQAGDIIFPDDKFMSNNHCVIDYDGKNFFIEDTGSSNGVFLRITGKVDLKDYDQLLIGKELFKYRAPTE